MLDSLQKNAITLFNLSYNLFITGSAGTGKSYLIRHMLSNCNVKPENVMITSTTGISALNINGKTIHSLYGIMPDTDFDNPDKFIKTVLNNHKYLNNWLNTKILIIDEISMMHPDMLDFLEYVARKTRESTKPFGGIQLLVTGDFYQLPPVAKKVKYCFESKCWNTIIDFTIQLKKNHRQNDNSLIEFLNCIREGVITPFVETELEKYKNNKNYNDNYTHLYANKTSVSQHNIKKLNQLTNTSISYKSVVIPKKQHTNANFPKDTVIVENLIVKVGAFVILTKNIDNTKGLVNGRQGVITKCNDNNIVIKTDDNEIHSISKSKWEFSNCYIEQFPIRLAWAITIHKSQGMGIEKLSVDIGNSIFDDGQVYVALSRAITSEYLHIQNYSTHSIKVNSRVKHFYQTLQDKSDTWTTKKDSTGKIYYQNVISGKTKWKKPKGTILSEDLQLETKEKIVKIPDNLKCKMCNENKYQDLHFNFFDEKICKTCCINNDEFRLLTKNEIMELHNTTFSKNKINIILKDLMYKPEPNPFNPRFSQIKVYLLKHFVEASNLHNKNSTNKTSINDMDKDLNNNTIKLSTNNPKVNSDKKNKIDYREIYNKYFIEDLTIGEIAKRVNRQNSTVESYLVKAHKNGMPYKDKQLNKLGISPELITEIKNFILLWKSKNTTQELPKLKLIKDNINTKVSYLSIKIVLEFI